MTKQEAIEILSALWKKDILPVDGQDALVIAIKALEQTDVPDTNVGELDGDPIDIDKAVEHYEGTLEVLKGIDLEDKE